MIQNSNLQNSRVAAVIVTYQPDLARLRQLLAAVESQVQHIIIVDNGSSRSLLNDVSAALSPGHHLISLGDNVGIASAQNRGLDYVRTLDAHFILWLDQDSIPPPRMVARLVFHCHALKTAGLKVATIGPGLADARWKSEQRMKPTGTKLPVADVLETDHIIASGSLVPIDILGVVGGLRDELFIDYVDIEWCLRAAERGFSTFIATDVAMDHRLGTPMRVMGRVISTHSPMRHYYMVRNTLWMARQPWLPARWRYRKLPKVGLHLLINAVFAKPHRAHWRMMLRGIGHGLTGKMGRGHL